mmetsp:Transcript_91954/g.197037  ORF Transcript_91954/g.197037 Transcript_91954/m.197037 type:complete len:212 (+) Transcript_91954:871-1506(+)
MHSGPLPGANRYSHGHPLRPVAFIPQLHRVEGDHQQHAGARHFCRFLPLLELLECCRLDGHRDGLDEHPDLVDLLCSHTGGRYPGPAGHRGRKIVPGEERDEPGHEFIGSLRGELAGHRRPVLRAAAGDGHQRHVHHAQVLQGLPSKPAPPARDQHSHTCCGRALPLRPRLFGDLHGIHGLWAHFLWGRPGAVQLLRQEREHCLCRPLGRL